MVGQEDEDAVQNIDKISPVAVSRKKKYVAFLFFIRKIAAAAAP